MRLPRPRLLLGPPLAYQADGHRSVVRSQFTTVARRQLPAGTYMVWAKAWIAHTRSGPTSVTCTLAAGPLHLDTADAVLPDPGPLATYATVPLLGTCRLETDGHVRVDAISTDVDEIDVSVVLCAVTVR